MIEALEKDFEELTSNIKDLSSKPALRSVLTANLVDLGHASADVKTLLDTVFPEDTVH